MNAVKGYRPLAVLVAAALLGGACGTVGAGRSSDHGAPGDGDEPASPLVRPDTGSTAPHDGAVADGVPGAPGLPRKDAPLPRLRLVELVTLEAPIDTTVLDDGTVLIAERAGRVRVLHGATPGPIVLDISDRTTTDGERGLLAIEVAPWGDELFVSLTDRNGDTLVEAYPIDGTRVTGPPRHVYATGQPFPNHNGGPIAFLSDGTLLLGLGDGGGRGDPLGAGQDLTTPLGAIVRLDVSGQDVSAPSDNPFADRADAAPEIAAFGLRNPWRMTVDRPRGEVWIADVGQSSREEINRIDERQLLGANFGWPLREGNARYLGDEPAGHVPPVFDYPHGPGCSVTGGLVYRGSVLPELVGAYVFTDLCDGRLRVLSEDGSTVHARELGVSGDRIIGFGTDADGEVLVLELGGRVLRLAPR